MRRISTSSQRKNKSPLENRTYKKEKSNMYKKPWNCINAYRPFNFSIQLLNKLAASANSSHRMLTNPSRRIINRPRH